jgi:hypothetical protein
VATSVVVAVALARARVVVVALLFQVSAESKHEFLIE